MAIDYSGDEDSILYASDAAYADHDDRKSTEGFLFKLFGGLVDWRAAKQKTVTTSTTEAELLAISHGAKDTYWWRRLFTAIGLEIGSASRTLSILCDNSQTVDILTKEEPELKTKLKHVDVHHFWLRQEAQAKRMQIEWVPTSRMPADGLTKALTRQKHEDFIKMLGLVDISTKITGTSSRDLWFRMKRI